MGVRGAVGVMVGCDLLWFLTLCEVKHRITESLELDKHQYTRQSAENGQELSS